MTSDGSNSYTYDAEGHIKTAANPATTYTYDGSGQRVRKVVSGENVRFVYGLGGELIAEFDGSTGSLKREYVYGGGTVATIEPTAVNSNGTRYATADHLNSPRVVTNSSGAVVSRHDYMPFGEELFAGTGGRTVGMGFSVVDGNRKKFGGYERDTETGLDFAQARYSSSALGRFTSPDPFAGSMRSRDPQSFNRYAYVRNNPVNRTDPTGLFDATDEVRSTRWVMSQSFGMDGERRPDSDFDWSPDPRMLPEPQEEVTVTVDAEVVAPLAGAAADPQNSGRILIIVGDPGLGEHNAGGNFDRVAATKQQELEALGYVVIVVRASSDSDFARALTSNGTLNGVEYIGHASYNALYVGEQSGDHTNLTNSDLSMLSNANLSPNAYIKLNACYAGSGGSDSIAAGISTQLQRTTLAFDGGTIFSGSERARVTERTKSGQEVPPHRGSLYLIEDRGTALRRFTP